MEFEVNFAPHKKTNLGLELLKKTWLVILVLAVSVGIIVFLGFFAKRITQKSTHMVNVGQEFLKVTQEQRRVSDLTALLSQCQKERLAWTQKVTALSEAIPQEIFLTSLEFEKVKKGGGRSLREQDRDKLVLKGFVLPSGRGDPASSIQTFMKNLKAQPTFMAGFEDPVLVSVNKSQQDKRDEGVEFKFHLLRKREG